MKTLTVKIMKNLEGREIMKGISKIISFTFLVVAVSLSSFQLAVAGSKGESGGQFLRIGAGARGPAMAGAFSTIVNDATAIYWNPAGLARMEKREVSLGYNAYFEDTAAQFVGYGHPTESHGTFGGGVSLFGVTDIQRRSASNGDADSPDLGTFNTQDFAVSFGWANKRDLFSGKFNYGLALKYIRSDLETEKAATVAVDLGVIHNTNEEARGLSLSLAILNLGGELKFKDEGDPLPLNIKPGAAWRFQFERFGWLDLAVDSDLLVNDGIAFVQPGFEWRAHKAFALRGGYQIGRDKGAGSGLGVGAGFYLFNLNLNYAFVPFGDLGDTHRVSIGFKF